MGRKVIRVDCSLGQPNYQPDGSSTPWDLDAIVASLEPCEEESDEKKEEDDGASTSGDGPAARGW